MDITDIKTVKSEGTHVGLDSSLNIQEGGNHYKGLAIQPVEFITKNNIPFIEGCVIKYVCRHKKKNGAEDIRKAIHFLQMLLELEYNETY